MTKVTCTLLAQQNKDHEIELLRPVFDARKDPDNRVGVYPLVQRGRRDNVLYVDVRFVFGQRAHLSENIRETYFGGSKKMIVDHYPARSSRNRRRLHQLS
jgi:hypothetical protein